VAPSRMVSVSASLIFPCTIKSRRRFLLAPAHRGSPGNRVVKRLCVCVYYCITCEISGAHTTTDVAHACMEEWSVAYASLGSNKP